MPTVPIELPIDRITLECLAAKYIWWKTPEDAINTPNRIISQVMNIGDFEDMQALAAAAGDKRLSDVLRTAEAGQFNARSWAYWHYRLKLANLETLPPLPKRQYQ